MLCWCGGAYITKMKGAVHVLMGRSVLRRAKVPTFCKTSQLRAGVLVDALGSKKGAVRCRTDVFIRGVLVMRNGVHVFRSGEAGVGWGAG